MPRENIVQDQEAASNSQSLTLTGFKEWFEAQSELKVSFDMTHLDYVADKLNELLAIDEKQHIKGQDVLQAIYDELSGMGENMGGGVASAKKAFELLNEYSGISTLGDERTQEEIQMAVDHHVKSWQGDRAGTSGFLTGFGAFLISGVSYGEMLANNGFPEGQVFVGGFCGGVITGVLTGMAVGAFILGSAINAVKHKKDLKEAEEMVYARAESDCAKFDDKLKSLVEEDRFMLRQEKLMFRSSVPVAGLTL